MNVVAVSVPAPGDVAPPLFSATRVCTASRFKHLGLLRVPTVRYSHVSLSSPSSLLYLSHLFLSHSLPLSSRSLFLFLSLLSFSLALALSLSLSSPLMRVSFFHRGASLSSIDAGLFTTSRLVPFLRQGLLLPFRVHGEALALLPRIGPEAMHCGRSHLLQSMLRQAVERASPRACLSTCHAAFEFVRKNTSSNIIRAAGERACRAIGQGRATNGPSNGVRSLMRN